MSTELVAHAWRRVEAVLQRRPDVGLHDDSPAVTRWEAGTRVVASHPNGTRVASDMPAEFGGSGELITPGWLMRAGFASCTATCIAMNAAGAGIELQSLEVEVRSRSDSRGLYGMPDADGTPVPAAPQDLRMLVRVRAPGADAARLRAIVEQAYVCSPVAAALREPMPVDLTIDIDGH
jgi:uncharacterized OsmC-like protein